jgi:IS605 OrfB family transposase
MKPLPTTFRRSALIAASQTHWRFPMASCCPRPIRPSWSAANGRRSASWRVVSAALAATGSNAIASPALPLRSPAFAHDWQHRASADIARRFGAVTLEDLKTSSMVRANRGLARLIHEQGWRGFELKLSYKLEERGGALVKVNPAYSSQTCAACGAVDKASRESQSRFACRHCGSVEHADVNAAKVILCRSSAVLEGSAYAPVEARTNHALAA